MIDKCKKVNYWNNKLSDNYKIQTINDQHAVVIWETVLVSAHGLSSVEGILGHFDLWGLGPMNVTISRQKNWFCYLNSCDP